VPLRKSVKRAPRAPRASGVGDPPQERLKREALKAFARDGYDGASTRAIAEAAKANPSLIAYHFGSKEGLWRAAMEGVLDGFARQQAERQAAREGLDTAQTLRLIVRDFTKFCAKQPEFHRILTAEWAHGAPRIRALGEAHIKPMAQAMMGMLAQGQAEGTVAPGDPARLLYAIIGIAATAFAMGPEFALLTGREPATADGISQTVTLIERVVFSRHGSAAIVP
jgi:AcrR family transcriptional regulator